MQTNEIALLDHFAGQVIQGLYAAGEEVAHQAEWAKLAYSQAEWMLQARKELLDKQPAPAKLKGGVIC